MYLPQQAMCQLSLMAQVKCVPAFTTSVWCVRAGGTVVWPCALLPQHRRRPVSCALSTRAHAWSKPEVTS